MQCESCQQQEATIEYTTVAGDEKKTVHLCAVCAAALSQEQARAQDETSNIDPTPVKKKKVNVVVGHLASGEAKATACPGCGMTYEEFRKVGRLGCSTCYSAFAKPLKRLLKRIHGSDHHAGRGPGQAASPVASPSVPARGAAQDDVERLRAELNQAVADEAYERAAELRDQIARLEAEGV